MLGAADHVEHAGPRAADITFAGLLEVRVEEQHVVVVRTLAQGLDVFLCFCEIRFQVSHGVLSSFSERVGLEIGRDTSELQSLMRISYAVFCLKKKKKIQ